MFQYLDYFKKGDEVPSWMLDVEPATGGGEKPIIRFGFDCHVVEVEMGYFVIPDKESKPDCAYSIIGGGTNNHVTLFASSRTVNTPMRLMVTKGEDESD